MATALQVQKTVDDGTQCSVTKRIFLLLMNLFNGQKCTDKQSTKLKELALRDNSRGNDWALVESD